MKPKRRWKIIPLYSVLRHINLEIRPVDTIDGFLKYTYQEIDIICKGRFWWWSYK